MIQPSRATETTRQVKRAPERRRAAALEKLREFVETHGMRPKIGPQAFADFERELHQRFMEAERDVTPRGWEQSERFDEAWAWVAASFHTDVTVLANVIAIRPQRAAPAPRKRSR
jgi:hypothetical protein